MKMEEVKAMLCVDHIVWNALASLLEKHPAENLHAGGSPPWTSRDAYAHFARWFGHNNACLQAYSAGRPLPRLSTSPEEMNDIWQREDSSLGLAAAREKAQAAFARRLDIIESIPLHRWDAELRRIADMDGAMHFARHINYIVVS